jgi:hypothetical protein
VRAFCATHSVIIGVLCRYALGAVFGFAAMVCSVLLLALNLYWTLKQPDQPAVLTPVVQGRNEPLLFQQWTITETYVSVRVQVPGVNVPSSHLAYYMIALAVAGVIHEIGHALAATRCRNTAYHKKGEGVVNTDLIGVSVVHAGSCAARTCR